MAHGAVGGSFTPCRNTSIHWRNTLHPLCWKKLILAASFAVLPACGSSGGESSKAPESLGQTGGAALSAGTQQPERLGASTRASPIAGKFRKSSDVIPGQYIVVLKEAQRRTAQVPELAQALALQHGATVVHTYSHALHGFAARTNEAGARALAARPEVDYVVEDSRVHAAGTQANATWGLDRIDQINGPLNGSYSYGATGAGVNVYIIDTGILTSHSEFGGRASGAFTSVNDGNGTNDCHGHGTHVAGTVGGTTWGVAKGARLHAVRVLDCNGDGTASTTIAGVDWVTANRVKPAVANMSLGGDPNDALDDAVRGSIVAGVTYVISAGNSYTDACGSSPGRTAEAITVGATDSADSMTAFSNWGPCVDLFAPGEDIRSASLAGSSVTLSGTSMAAPHVAGAAAVYLESNPGAAPATVATALVINSPPNKVTGTINDSPTRLLHSNPPPACGKLSSGQALAPGQTLHSCAGTARLAHQTDGSVVVYDRLGLLWDTNTYLKTTSTFIMQTDGHLVLYSGSASALWYSGTYGNGGAYLAMQDDCNLVVYSPSGTPLWASMTFCR